MSYEPTNWQAGDTVTSAKLNKLEQGVAGAGVLVVNIDPETRALDKTWQEIHDAGLTVVWVGPSASDKHLAFIYHVYGELENYSAIAIMIENDSTIEFTTDSAEGYPAIPAPDPDGGED